MARSTKAAAQATRHRIIDAAEQVFQDRGVAHASLEEIAGAAGVTRGAIYWHFRDKAELFDAMMQRVTLPVEAMIDRAEGAGKADQLELLKRSATEVLLRMAREKHLQRVFDIAHHKCEYVGDAAALRARRVASQKECLRAIEAGFGACRARGLLPRTVDPKVAAIGALSLVSGLIANWILDPRSFSLERHARSLVDIYFRGLEAAPARKPRRNPAR